MSHHRDHERALMASIIPELKTQLSATTSPVVVLEVESDLVMELVLESLRLQKNLQDVEGRKWLVRELKRNGRRSVLANLTNMIAPDAVWGDDSSYWEGFSTHWQQLDDQVGQVLVIPQANSADVRMVEKFLSLQKPYKPLVVLCVGLNVAGKLVRGPKTIAHDTIYARITPEDIDHYLTLSVGLSSAEEAALRVSVELVEEFIAPTQLICLLRLLPAIGFERARSVIAGNVGASRDNAAGHHVLAAAVETWMETLEFSERLLLSTLALLTLDRGRLARVIWEDAVRRLMGDTDHRRWMFRLRSELAQSLVVQHGDFVRFSHETWAMAIHAYLAKQPEPFKNGIRAMALVGIGDESEKISTLARADRRKEILLDEMTGLAWSLLQTLPLSYWPQIDARMMDVIRRVLADIEDDNGTVTLALTEKVLNALGLNSENAPDIARTPYEASAFAKLARQALEGIRTFVDSEGKVGSRLRALIGEALDTLRRIPASGDPATVIGFKLLALRIEQAELELTRIESNTTYAKNDVETVSTAEEEVPEDALGAHRDATGLVGDPSMDLSGVASSAPIELPETVEDEDEEVDTAAREAPLDEELDTGSERKRHEESEALVRLTGRASNLTKRFEECAREALSQLDDARSRIRNPERDSETSGLSVSVRLNDIIPGIYRHGAKAAQLAGTISRERWEESESGEGNDAEAQLAHSYLDQSERLLLLGQKHQPSNIDIQYDILRFELDVKCLTTNAEVDLKKTSALIDKVKNDWKARPHPYFQDLLINALRQYLSTDAGRNNPPTAMDSVFQDLLNSILGAGTRTRARTKELSKLISIVTVNIGNNDLAVDIFDKLIEGEHNSAILKSAIPGAAQRVLDQLRQPGASLDNAIRFARKLDRVAIESGNVALAEAANEGANSVYDQGLQVLADDQLESVTKKGVELKLAASENETEERDNLTAYLNAISDSNRLWRQLAWDSKIRHLRLANKGRSWRDFDRLLMVELVSLMQDEGGWQQYKISQIAYLFRRAGENEPLLRPMAFMKRLGLRREQFALACLVKSTKDQASSRRWRYEARFHAEHAEKLYRHATAFRERIRVWRVLKYLMEKEGRHIEAGYYDNYIRRAQRTVDIDRDSEKKQRWDAKAYLYAGRELMFVEGSEGRGALLLLLGISRADTLPIEHPLRRQLRTLYAQSFWSRLYAQNMGAGDDGRIVGPMPLPAEQLERFVSGEAKSLMADLLMLAALMPRELKAGTFAVGRISHFDQANDRLVVEHIGKSGEPKLALVARNVMPVTFYNKLNADPTLSTLRGLLVPISGLRLTIDGHAAASMRGGKYCYDAINLIAPKIVTAYRRTRSSKNSRIGPQHSRNALVLGASNSWLVFRIHPDFIDMFRHHDGLLVKQLSPMLSLRRITFSKFSLEYDAGEYKRAELEDFIDAAWNGCSILSWNWREKKISIKTPGSLIDSRKSRTFSSMLKKAFPYDVKTVQLL